MRTANPHLVYLGYQTLIKTEVNNFSFFAMALAPFLQTAEHGSGLVHVRLGFQVFTDGEPGLAPMLLENKQTYYIYTAVYARRGA